LFYTTAKKTIELRIHFVFPCSVTLKIEFSRENLAQAVVRIWGV